MKQRNRGYAVDDDDFRHHSSSVLSEIIKWLCFSVSGLSTALFVYRYLVFLVLRPNDAGSEHDDSMMRSAQSNGCIYSTHDMEEDVNMVDEGTL